MWPFGRKKIEPDVIEDTKLIKELDRLKNAGLTIKYIRIRHSRLLAAIRDRNWQIEGSILKRKLLELGDDIAKLYFESPSDRKELDKIKESWKKLPKGTYQSVFRR